MDDNKLKEPSRLSRRVNRLRNVRSRSVGPRKRLIAACMSGVFAALTLYVIIFLLGFAELNWTLTGLAFGLGVIFGGIIGAQSIRSGAGAGILAGAWIFMEMLLLAFAVVMEAIGAIIGAILSSLSI